MLTTSWWMPLANQPCSTMVSADPYNLCDCVIFCSSSKPLKEHSSSQIFCLAGASFFYKPHTLPYEAQEVRAFGLFLSDLIARMDSGMQGGTARQKLDDIATACLVEEPMKRPAFAAIAAALGSS